MDNEKLFNERKNLFRDTIAFKKTARVPLMSNVTTWKIFDEGIDFGAAITDYNIMENLERNFFKRYQFDSSESPGFFLPKGITDALGATTRTVDVESGVVNAKDHKLMEEDEYVEFAKDPSKFKWEKAFKRFAPNLTQTQFKNGIIAFLQLLEFNAKDVEMLKTECGVPLPPMLQLLPYEHIFNTYRGIKGMSMDLRRRPDEMANLLDILYEPTVSQTLNDAVSGANADCVGDLHIGCIGHSILNPKQFERFYWKYLQKELELLKAANKVMILYSEGSMLRFADYFQELPKGLLLLQVEMDNIFEVRKRLPNIALAGGMTTDLLGKGTVQQCIDYTKKLVAELGEGYVMSQNKMVAFRNDCKRETLLAVNDYLRNC